MVAVPRHRPLSKHPGTHGQERVKLANILQESEEPKGLQATWFEAVAQSAPELVEFVRATFLQLTCKYVRIFCRRALTGA